MSSPKTWAVLPAAQRDREAAGPVLALTVTGREAEVERLRAEGTPVTMPAPTA
ncbi:hypothetical protein [Streptomyces sp. NPDC006463]|uniref:hypothetical protein n=1 Tax=Streptomyces sp. NPDC006463 TaxID=3364746 RepID=UPI0036BD7C2B